MTVHADTVVAATPAAVYEAVSDPTQMGRWSPENRGATMSSGAAVAVGDSFEGHNKRGRVQWTTRCVVTAAEPGERFAFKVVAIGLRKPRVRGPIATWEYRFEAVEGGTKVTESWTDDRRSWPDAIAGVFDRVVTSGSHFADFQQRNIEKTLRGLQRELGAPTGA